VIPNLCLLFLAIAKVALVCGFAPAIAIAILYQQVSAGGQLAFALSKHAVPTDRMPATSPPREESVAA
jgi:hypothetical protein